MVTTSRHAQIRIKQRCGVSKKSADRVAQLAASRGITREATKGPLRKWLDAKQKNSDKDVEIVVWGDKAFLFSADSRLITCIQIPQAISRKMKRMFVVNAVA